MRLFISIISVPKNCLIRLPALFHSEMLPKSKTMTFAPQSLKSAFGKEITNVTVLV